MPNTHTSFPSPLRERMPGRAGEGESQTKNPFTHLPYGPYEKYFKRPLDIACAVGMLVCFWWLFVILAILVRIKLGSPVLFTQERPGKDDHEQSRETQERIQ